MLSLRRFLMLLAGCGGDDDASEAGDDAQPAPGVTTFEEGGFDDIPLHPGSEVVGERTEEDCNVAQSHEVTGATPEQVVRFYEDSLPQA